jgi:DNA-binding NtrC family response regulator
MDDEEIIRTVMTDLIECLGHKCITAENGEKALEIYKKHFNSDNPVNCVILDISIAQGMGAESTITELLKIDSDVTAVVSSGDPESPIMRNFSQYGFKDTLKKPCRMADIQELFKRQNLL